jgi:protein-disulfide isomerase
MLKLAIAAAVLTAAGTTAYVVHKPTVAAPVAAAAPAPAVAAAPHAAAPHAAQQVATPTLPAAATQQLPPGARRVAPPDEQPSIDRATSERLGLQRGPSRGPTTAPVTITVFTDMICPHCANALGSLDQLWEEYPGKLRLVVKQMPVHKAAVLAAEAALAADAQGKFWELHDLMLSHQDELEHDGLISLAERAGLDVAAFRTALDQHTFAKQVEADQATAKQLDFFGTPAFVINGRRIGGNMPVNTFRNAIDAALADL